MESSDGVRLIVNVGIGGHAPQPYLFDTGSAPFVAAYSTSAFGNIPSNMASSGLPTGVTFNYGGTSGNSNNFTANLVAAPSLTFYATPSTPAGSVSGVTLNAATPSGAPSNFIIAAAYQHDGNPINTAVPLQSLPPVFAGLYGIFGAGDFAIYATGSAMTTNTTEPGTPVNTNEVAIGSVLGQSVVSGTTAGYVVAANGQALSGAADRDDTCPRRVG